MVKQYIIVIKTLIIATLIRSVPPVQWSVLSSMVRVRALLNLQLSQYDEFNELGTDCVVYKLKQSVKIDVCVCVCVCVCSYRQGVVVDVA